MVKPNFFIVGAPKCGTTALSEYLREHPNIYMCDPKEPHFFNYDFEQYRVVKTLEEYLSLFEASTSEHFAIGEASALYLYSSVALEKIQQFDPQAKIIVMLRNPVDLAYSYHSQLLYASDENEQDFEQAWRLQSIRRKGKKIPKHCRNSAILQYAAVARLGEQIERLLGIFPRKQVEIIFFDDFTNSTKQVYEKVLKFLEVPGDNRTDFRRINQNKSHKLRVIGNFSERPPEFLNDHVMRAKKILGLERLYILDAVRYFNNKVTTRQPLSASFRAELVAEFESDIKKLSQLLDKDLSHWLLEKSPKLKK
ncbi:sulfotransferase domain-containing protein [Pleurocapsa sp. PCC 7319]|uniref:sulfotransferase domain-containing protein n=1 Tax=Pleurocapsa sp. PCC 7319 TaxID=118161 RepID=UPI000349C829|nr:sulfotransferase domain-containing protein [Pleurocapsa sp. PCC 7319]